jgi:hypothetical protein
MQIESCRTQRLNPAIVGEDQAIIITRFAGGAAGLIDANRFTGPVPAPVAMGTCIVEGADGMLRVSPHGEIFLTPAGAQPCATGSASAQPSAAGIASITRVSPQGETFLTSAREAEQRLPFTPPTQGYKGDSVYATQAHLIEGLGTGAATESDGRDYLRTVALVETCYALASGPSGLR